MNFKLPKDTLVKVKNQKYQLSIYDVKIKREINTILLPLFTTWKWWRGLDVEYDIDFWKRKWKVIISWNSKLWTPSEFDYKVFIGLLKIHALQWWDEIRFSSIDLIRILNIRRNGKNYSLLKDAIQRLVKTTYTFKNLFYTKTDKWDTITEEEIEFHIFDERRSITKKERINGEEEIKKDEYILHFWRQIKNNLDNKYFKYFDSKLLLWLSWNVWRFYEIIEFQRNGALSCDYIYNTLEKMIPLNSGRMNKKLIVWYAEKLVGMWYIKDYKKGISKINISFLDNDSKKDIWKDKLLNIKQILNYFIENFWLSETQVISIAEKYKVDHIVLAKEYTIEQRRLKLNSWKPISNIIPYFLNILELDEIPKTKDRIRREKERS